MKQRVVAAVVRVSVVDHGVPGMTRGGGNGSGEGDGHEAKALALKVLHGGAHVLFHQLRHLLLRHR